MQSEQKQSFKSDNRIVCDLGIPLLIIDSLPISKYLLNISLANGSFLTNYYIHLRCINPIEYTCGDAIDGELSSLQPYQYRSIVIPNKMNPFLDFNLEDESRIRYELEASLEHGQIISIDSWCKFYV